MKPLTATINSISRTRRLLIALIIGLAIFTYVQFRQSGAVAFMIAWIGFAVVTLFFSWTTIFTKHPKEIAVVATEQDNSPLFTFLFVVTGAFISLFAILLLLKGLPGYTKEGLTYHIILSAAAVTSSWLLIHTLFTLRYAHIFYNYETHSDKLQNKPPGGLSFPGHALPDLLDFAYFSFVLGMTFQVSDVEVTSRRMRRLALLHGLLSFVYNTVILALTINILSGIIGNK